MRSTPDAYEFPGAAAHDGDTGPDQGWLKDVQGILGHSNGNTTANVYMEPIEAGVKSTLDAIYSELTVAAGS